MSQNTTEAVVEVARRRKSDEQDIITLTSGIQARIKPVTASLIDQVTARIKDPEVPMWHNKEKDRDEPNYAHPEYIRGMQSAERERGIAAMDAIIMFGVELVDGVPNPEEDDWLEKLQYLGIVVEPKSALEREFLYKKYVAVSPDDVELVTKKSGIAPEDIEAAEKSFRSKAEGNTD